MEAAEAHAEPAIRGRTVCSSRRNVDAPKIDAMNATTAEEEGGVVEGADEVGRKLRGRGRGSRRRGGRKRRQTAAGEEEVGEEPPGRGRG